jgi:hypothetical protein
VVYCKEMIYYFSIGTKEEVHRLFNFSFVFWRNSPMRGWAASFLKFLDHTHKDTPHARGLLWSNDRPVATWQHTAVKRDRPSCLQRDSNRYSCKRSAVDPCLRPLGQWDRHRLYGESGQKRFLKIWMGLMVACLKAPHYGVSGTTA